MPAHSAIIAIAGRFDSDRHMKPVSPSPRELEERLGSPLGALVMDAHNFHGVAIIRALGQLGLPVYAYGAGVNAALGFYSRYLRGKWLCGEFGPLLDALLETGRRFAAEGRRVVLFPTRDVHVKLLAENQAAVSRYFIVHQPLPEIINQCRDKQAQCQAARRVGVPLPLTYFEGELDKLREDLAAGRLLFPVLFKAREELPGHLKPKFRFIVVENGAQLSSVLESAQREQIPFLVQEIIPGGDDTLYTFGSCRTREGKLTAIFTGRKLRQRPPRFGECRVGESKHVEAIIQDGEKLLRAMNFFGISQVEFKYDARDGRYKLMELNPRAWSWIGLPIAMGINIPYAFFCDALGVESPVFKMPDERALWISLYYDWYWSLKARDGWPWVHYLRPYDRVVEGYFSLRDPAVGLVHAWYCASDSFSAFVRRFKKRS
jgi:D-aspartate ligase